MPQFPTSKYSASPAAGAFVRAQGSHSPMLEPDVLPPNDPSYESLHPFKVINPTFASTTMTFGLYVGHVFGMEKDEMTPPWSVDENNITVGKGNLTETPAGIVTPGILDERNVGTLYSGTVSNSEDNVLYVQVSRATGSGYWEATLQLRTVAYAQSAYDTDAIRCEFDSEALSDIDYNHSGITTPPTTFSVTLSGAMDTFVLDLNTRFSRFTTTSKYFGKFQVPIAFIRSTNQGWQVRQVLRSDIFFPYGIDVVTKYIDGYVEDFTGTGGCGP